MSPNETLFLEATNKIVKEGKKYISDKLLYVFAHAFCNHAKDFNAFTHIDCIC